MLSFETLPLKFFSNYRPSAEEVLKELYLCFDKNLDVTCYIGQGIPEERLCHLWNGSCHKEYINNIPFEHKFVIRLAVGPELFIKGAENYLIKNLLKTGMVYNSNLSIKDTSEVDKFNLMYEEILHYVKSKKFLDTPDCKALKPTERFTIDLTDLFSLPVLFITNKYMRKSNTFKYHSYQMSKGSQYVTHMENNPSDVDFIIDSFKEVDIKLLEKYVDNFGTPEFKVIFNSHLSN